MIENYLDEKEKRRQQGIPAEPLSETQTRQLCRLLEDPPAGREALLLDLLRHRVPPGVDAAAGVKADFLGAVAKGEKTTPLLDPPRAVGLLGTMRGGYSIKWLIALLDDPALASLAAQELAGAVFVFENAEAVWDRVPGNPHARAVIDAWARADWFLKRPPVAERITLTVFKVEGEITTDDFSPAGEAGTRSDIPLHARSMLRSRCEGALETITDLKKKGHPLVFAGDVVGTGSSRKSAVNSLLWHIGDDIPYVPNKRRGGVVLGGKIAPIFFNTLEDAGALPVECAVSGLATGDVVTLFPHAGYFINESRQQEKTLFRLRPSGLLDEVRAGGRIPLIAGRTLTNTVRRRLGQNVSKVFTLTARPAARPAGFTLAQKIVGRACGKTGVVPGEYCEPVLATVGSQDTTGPMTRDELKELACLRFSADLVMQSFCHTAAYPTDRDRVMHKDLTEFFVQRGGVALRPGDGVIHSWINRMLLPDTLGTGGDSHTRFPVGLSFPAGSGLVAFGAALGKMPLDMPDSVRVRFSGRRRPGITLRDMVNIIPLAAMEQGMLTVAKENKQNVFSGRILEMEGTGRLTVDQGFELTDASAERSAAAATIQLTHEAVTAYIRGNTDFLEQLIQKGYADKATLARRMGKMKQWLAAPELLQADPDAEYAAVLDIDLDRYAEPVLACPNDPDDVRVLSAVSGEPIDEVFIGSCMTNVSHFRRAARLLAPETSLACRLWLAPPTVMDREKLAAEGLLDIFHRLGARMEIPGCSLCMGNQARVAPDTTVMSTSTRNFPHRMGDHTRVYLGSAEVAAICAGLGRIPTLEEYFQWVDRLEEKSV